MPQTGRSPSLNQNQTLPSVANRKDTKLSATPVSNPTIDPTAVNPVPTGPDDLATLQAKLVTANQDMATHTLAAQEAFMQSPPDVRGAIAATDKVKKAQADIARLEAQIKKHGFEVHREERDATIAALEQGLFGVVDGAIDVLQHRELGIIGAAVLFHADGTITVKATMQGAPKVARLKKEATNGGQGGQKGNWAIDGQLLPSIEFLGRYGDRLTLEVSADKNPKGIVEYGTYYLDRNENWQDYGLSSRPGFDTAVKKLADAVGAVRDVS